MNEPKTTQSDSVFRPALFTKIMLGALMLGSGMLLSGCNKALAPTFQAVGVREIEQGDERSVIEFSIEATNPNKEPIPLRQVHYKVELDGVEVFSGVRSPEIMLHMYSSHVFTLPAVLPIEAIKSSGEVSYALTGTVQYIPPGRLSEVLFDAKLKVPEAILELSGTINMGPSTGAWGE